MRARQQARTTDQAQEIARTLTTTILTIPVLAGAGDRLYGSVTPADIADEIWRARKIRVDRRKVQLDEPIRRWAPTRSTSRSSPRSSRPSRRWSCRPRARRSTCQFRRLSPAVTRSARRLAAKSGYALRAARSARDGTAKVRAVERRGGDSAPEREDAAGPSRPRTSTPSSRCSAPCCSPRLRSRRPPRSSKAEDFYRGGHGEIFAAMLDLYQRSEPVDQVSVCDRLDQRGSLEQVGGRPARVRAGRGRPRRHERAALCRDRARDGHAARLIRVGTEVAQLGYDRPGEMRELLDMAEQKVYEIAQNGTARGLHAHQAAARRGLPPPHGAVRERRRQRRRRGLRRPGFGELDGSRRACSRRTSSSSPRAPRWARRASRSTSPSTSP